MTVEVRLATADDKTAVLRMAVRFINETGYARYTNVNVPQLERLLAYLLEHGAVFVATAGRELVGMLGVALVSHPISGDLTGTEICWWVEPEARHSTAGIRLLKAGKQFAAQAGAKVFQMVAPKGSKVAHLYESLGFEEVETTWQIAIGLDMHDE